MLRAGHADVQALQESGGAIALAAGGTFCLALTAMGKVIVWGKIGGPAGQRGARPAVAEIIGLPPITSIAAGQSHALMTDGERVWALGRQAHMLALHLMLKLLCCMSLVSCRCRQLMFGAAHAAALLCWPYSCCCSCCCCSCCCSCCCCC